MVVSRVIESVVLNNAALARVTRVTSEWERRLMKSAGDDPKHWWESFGGRPVLAVFEFCKKG